MMVIGAAPQAARYSTAHSLFSDLTSMAATDGANEGRRSVRAGLLRVICGLGASGAAQQVRQRVTLDRTGRDYRHNAAIGTLGKGLPAGT
jgi:hypothetical protein